MSEVSKLAGWSSLKHAVNELNITGSIHGLQALSPR